MLLIELDTVSSAIVSDCKKSNVNKHCNKCKWCLILYIVLSVLCL